MPSQPTRQEWSSRTGWCRYRRMSDQAAHHAEVIGWKDPGVAARNRSGAQQFDARGRPSRALQKHSVETHLPVLVLAVESHEVDGRVLGETLVVRPQHRPHVAVGRDDPRVLVI